MAQDERGQDRRVDRVGNDPRTDGDPDLTMAEALGYDATVQRFWDTWQELDKLYDRYARRCGMSYTSMRILDEIWCAEELGRACTQKYICEQTFLPKQTVNSVVTGFQRDGIVELVELPEDRRARGIRFTESGRKLGERTVALEHEVENVAFAQFTPEECDAFLNALERFTASCRTQLEG